MGSMHEFIHEGEGNETSVWRGRRMDWSSFGTNPQWAQTALKDMRENGTEINIVPMTPAGHKFEVTEFWSQLTAYDTEGVDADEFGYKVLMKGKILEKASDTRDFCYLQCRLPVMRCWSDE